MSFNENARLDPSRVSDARGRGGRAGVAIGGGGGILVLLLAIIFGPQAVSGLVNTSPGELTTNVRGTGGTVLNDECTSGAAANQRSDCLIVGTLNSLDDYWAGAAQALRVGDFVAPAAQIFSGSTATACGNATSAVGPFYCPGDSTIYIDPDFFQELTSSYGADSGQLAQEYVVAHEYGHHMQALTGTIGNSSSGSGATGGSVRVELQADCYAGVWANHAASTADASGRRFLEPLTNEDVTSALSAAAAVGDDHLQKQATGRVNPESWTHGSSAERQAWFMQGYRQGDPGACDTFSARDLTRP